MLHLMLITKLRQNWELTLIILYKKITPEVVGEVLRLNTEAYNMWLVEVMQPLVERVATDSPYIWQQDTAARWHTKHEKTGMAVSYFLRRHHFLYLLT